MSEPKTIDELLAEARTGLTRVSPHDAAEAMAQGALLIDIRSDSQRGRDGLIPGARFIERNVFEWRCDPRSPWRETAVARPEHRLIVICNQGFQSSLAAATLLSFGYQAPGDVIGGFQAWRAAGLPVIEPSA